MSMRNEPGNCRTSVMRNREVLANLSASALRELSSLQNPLTYAANTVVYSENELVKGIYTILDGEVKLSINSPEGKRLSLHIARKGEVLGLTSVLSGCPYEATAESIFAAKLAMIERRDFLNFLTRHPEAHQVLMLELSRQYSIACDQLRTLGLAASAPERLARLLLNWSETGIMSSQGTSIRFAMTHEEVGEFIGASRETVTRTLMAFRNQKLVEFHGSTLTILNKLALAGCAGE